MKKYIACGFFLVASIAFAQTFPVNNLQVNGNAVVNGNTSIGGTTSLGSVPAHNLVVGQGSSPVTSVVPSTTGYSLLSNGGAVDPSFQQLTAPIINYTAPGSGAVSRTQASKNGDIVSVKDYGAKGDGVINDTAAEAAAITAVCAVGGGTVYYPPGVYLTTPGVLGVTTPFCNGLQFVGSGAGSGGNAAPTGGTIISVAATTGVLFTFNTLGGVGIRDLSISYTNTPTAGSAITLNNVYQFVLQNVLVYGAWNPVSVLGGGVPQIFDHFFFINTVTGGTDFFINSGNDQYISNGLMYSPFTTPLAGFRIDATAGVWISNVDVVHKQYNMLIDPQSGQTVEFLFVDNVGFDTCTSYCMYINPSSGGSVLSNTFSGSWFASGSIGVYVSTNGGLVDGLRIDGGRIFNNQNQGMLVNPIGGGINHVWVSNTDVTGNSQSSSGTYSGIEFGAGVSNFSLTGNTSTVQGPFGNTQRFGILVDAGASNNYIISDNEVMGNVVAPISDNGTGSTKLLKGNLGYNPLSASVSVGASPFTWTNNLGDTATLIISGGTVSSVTLAGLAVSGSTNTSVAVPQGQSVVITYSATPTVVYKGY